MGDKTKIDWCDSTVNPVTGCRHGCEYCYARRIAERFGDSLQNAIPDTDLFVLNEPCEIDGEKHPYPFDFEPTFHRYRLEEPKHWTRPRTIFVCSMADLFGDWVPESWIQEVFAACDAAPQHTYLFLTKNPKRLQAMYNAREIQEYEKRTGKKHPQRAEFEQYTPLPRRDNWWWGSTVTKQDDRRFQGGISDHTFISIEPLMEYLDAGLGSFGDAEWVIIGAETGNRKGKVTPKKFWIDNIVEAAGITDAAVFMKSSLSDIMNGELIQEYPFKKPATQAADGTWICPNCGDTLDGNVLDWCHPCKCGQRIDRTEYRKWREAHEN